MSKLLNIHLKNNPDIIGLGIGHADAKSIGRYTPTDASSAYKIDWTATDETNRSRRYQLNTFIMLLPHLQDLLKDGLTTEKSVDDLRWALDIVLDFQIQHKFDPDDPEGKTSENTFAWYDMAVGIRSSILSALYDYCEKASPDIIPDTDRLSLKLMIQDHVRALENEKYWASHSNHGYYQSYGLFALARISPSALKKPVATRKLAGERLLNYLTAKVGPDGLHLEHSTAYHNFILRALLSLRPWLDEKSMVEKEIYDILGKMMAAQAALIMPNGFFAPFGDTDFTHSSGKLPFNPSILESLAEPLKHSLLSKKTDYRQVYDGRASGLMVLKSNRKDQSQYLAMTAMHHSRVHKQADDLSLIWSENGCPILTDPGRYGYQGKTELDTPLRANGFYYDNPKRIYVESAHAHNVVEVDNRTYNRKTSPAYGSAITGFHESPDVLIVEGEWFNPLGVKQIRHIIYRPHKSLLIVDHLSSVDGHAHDIKQWVHLFPCWSVLKDDQNWQAVFDPDWTDKSLGLEDSWREAQLQRRFRKRISPLDKSLSIQFSASEPCSDTLCEGIDQTRLEGWTSLSAAGLQPAPALMQNAQLLPERPIVMAAFLSLDDQVTETSAWRDSESHGVRILTESLTDSYSFEISETETRITLEDEHVIQFERELCKTSKQAQSVLKALWAPETHPTLSNSSGRMQRLKDNPVATLRNAAMRRLLRR